MRLISGELNGRRGVAETFSPVTVAHGIISQGKRCSLTIPAALDAAIYVTLGELRSLGENIEARRMALFNHDQETIHLSANVDSEFLLLAGEYIDEPVVQQGPFVMNTQEEIQQAMEDYEMGRMGVI